MVACRVGLLVSIAGLAAAGCTAVSSSRSLSGEPPGPTASGLYLVMRPPGPPHRTLGFVQVAAHGASLAGLEGASDTELDPVLLGALAAAAHRAGAEGAILVDVREILPPTAASRPWGVVSGAPPGRVATRARWVEVTAELFAFVRPGGPPP